MYTCEKSPLWHELFQFRKYSFFSFKLFLFKLHLYKLMGIKKTLDYLFLKMEIQSWMNLN
jgi:hypothetical protein